MRALRPPRWRSTDTMSAPVRNVLMVLVSLALAILLLDSWRSYASYHDTLNAARVNLTNLTRLMAAHTEASLEMCDALLAANVSYMERGPLSSGDIRQIQGGLHQAVRNSPRIATISVFDHQGNWVISATTPTPDLKQNFADREYFIFHRDHSDRGTHIGVPIQRKTTGEWAISVSRRWNQPDGSFGGLAVIVINLSYFQQFFGTLEIGQAGVLNMYRSDGILLARRAPQAGGIGKPFNHLDLFTKHLPKQRVGIFQRISQQDSQERILSYRQLDHFPIVVTAAFGIDDILAQWRADTLRHLALSLGLIIFFTLMGLRLIRQMQQRIKDVKELQQGQTKIEKLNQALSLRTQQAEAASIAKSQFLANMSHEIRTPMNAVLGMLQLLHHTGLSAQQRDYLGKVQTAAGTLLDIINDILDYSKIEAGKMTLDLQAFRLDQLLNDLALMLSASVGDKPLKVRVLLPPDLPPLVQGDALRLRQVLLNLAGNAIKFTAQGEVVISVRCISPHDRHDGDHVLIEFSVHDTGIGISAQQLQHIFEGFTQAEASTTRRYGGTGLGLAISQRLVQLMGGQLLVESVVDQGSHFHFALPLLVLAANSTAASVEINPANAANAATKLPGVPRLNGLRLLLVEDNDLNQQVAQALLSQQGAQVSLAGNGKIALEMLQAQKTGFDLVLMDIQMPVMDGFDATRLLRQMSGLETIPVIAMTANAMESDRQACLAVGMNDHVAKPFHLHQLVEVILRHVIPPDPANAPAAADAVSNASANIGHPATSTPPPGVLQLAQQHEIDLLTALARLESNSAFLPTALRMFANDARRMAEQIEPCLQAQQGPDLLRLLHTLKGTAAIVGADKLAERAQALEAILRNDANPNMSSIMAPELTSLGQSLLQTSEAISAMLALWDGAASQPPPAPAQQAVAADGASQANANTAATNRAAVQSTTLANDLLLLIELLQASNMAALDLQRQLHPALILLDAELAASLDDTMEQFNFVGAAAHCQRLLQFLDGANHA